MPSSSRLAGQRERGAARRVGSRRRTARRARAGRRSRSRSSRRARRRAGSTSSTTLRRTPRSPRSACRSANRLAAAIRSASGPPPGTRRALPVATSAARSSNSSVSSSASSSTPSAGSAWTTALQLVERERDRRAAEAVGRVADAGPTARGHSRSRDALRVPQGMPGAKLIAQTRTPGDASTASRWRSCRGCSAIVTSPAPASGSGAAAVDAARSSPSPSATTYAPPGLVLELDPVAARLRLPALGGRAAREDLVARRRDQGAGRVGRRAAAPSAAAAPTVRSSLRSTSWIASSVARYSPSPKCAHASAPPRAQRKSDGQPLQP